MPFVPSTGTYLVVDGQVFPAHAIAASRMQLPGQAEPLVVHTARDETLYAVDKPKQA